MLIIRNFVLSSVQSPTLLFQHNLPLCYHFLPFYEKDVLALYLAFLEGELPLPLSVLLQLSLVAFSFFEVFFLQTHEF